MTETQLTELILTVPCPICGAAAGEKCELNSGYPRTTPHSERRLNAAETTPTANPHAGDKDVHAEYSFCK